MLPTTIILHLCYCQMIIVLKNCGFGSECAVWHFAFCSMTANRYLKKFKGASKVDIPRDWFFYFTSLFVL